MVKFSVIVPVYKVEKYIGRCIESILGQSCDDFELILVNDGSLDDSGRICDEYGLKDSRIRVIHKENGGVSSARNAGLDVAKGQYIVFIDSDDEAMPDYLECMDGYPADLVVAGVRNVDEIGKQHGALEYPQALLSDLTVEDIEKMCENKALNFIYSKCYKASLIQEAHLRFDEAMHLAEDTLFVAEYLCRCSSVQYVAALPYLYYKYDSTTLSSFRSEYVQRLIDANAQIARVLDARFPGVAGSVTWKQRCWSVFHYSIFHVLRDWDVPRKKKYDTLKRYFAMPEFKAFSRLLDVYMQDEAIFWQKLLKTGNAFLVMTGWEIVRLSAILKGKNR